MDSKAYRWYVNAVNNASLLAQKEVDDLISTIDLNRPRSARDALIPAVTSIVTKWANVASMAAAEYYEAERDSALGGSYDALLAPPVDPAKVEKQVRFACGYLFDDWSTADGSGHDGLFELASGVR